MTPLDKTLLPRSSPGAIVSSTVAARDLYWPVEPCGFPARNRFEICQDIIEPFGGFRYGIGMCLGLAVLHMEARAQEVEEAEEHSASAILYSCTSTWLSIGTVFMRERPSAEDVKLVDVLVRVVRGIGFATRPIESKLRSGPAR